METETRISWQPPNELDLTELPGEWQPIRVGPDGRLSLPTQSPTVDLSRLIEWARQRGLDEIPELQVERPDLEEMYLELVDENQSLEQADRS